MTQADACVLLFAFLFAEIPGGRGFESYWAHTHFLSRKKISYVEFPWPRYILLYQKKGRLAAAFRSYAGCTLKRRSRFDHLVSPTQRKLPSKLRSAGTKSPSAALEG